MRHDSIKWVSNWAAPTPDATTTSRSISFHSMSCAALAFLSLSFDFIRIFATLLINYRWKFYPPDFYLGSCNVFSFHFIAFSSCFSFNWLEIIGMEIVFSSSGTKINDRCSLNSSFSCRRRRRCFFFRRNVKESSPAREGGSNLRIKAKGKRSGISWSILWWKLWCELFNYLHDLQPLNKCHDVLRMFSLSFISFSCFPSGFDLSTSTLGAHKRPINKTKSNNSIRLRQSKRDERKKFVFVVQTRELLCDWAGEWNR